MTDNHLEYLSLPVTNPTKMCIKYAPHLHQKGANQALNMMLFRCFGANVAH